MGTPSTRPLPAFFTRCKCISLHQLQYFNVFCVREYKPLLYKGRWYLILLNYFNYVQQICFVFVWCPCVAINVSVQHNGGYFPGIILLTQCYYHQEVWYLQAMIPPKRFDIFPPLAEGCSEGLDAFRFFFKHASGSFLFYFSVPSFWVSV